MLSRARLRAPTRELWRCKCLSRGRGSTSRTWACVCVAGAAFGSCLKGWGVVTRAAVGPHLAWHSQHFGDASVKSWQAQYFVHLGLRLHGRGSIWELSKGLGCCRARAAVRPHAGTLEMQVLKSWQGQYFAHLGLRLRGRGSIWELSAGLGCCRARGCGPPSRVAGAALWRGKC